METTKKVRLDEQSLLDLINASYEKQNMEVIELKLYLFNQAYIELNKISNIMEQKNKELYQILKGFFDCKKIIIKDILKNLYEERAKMVFQLQN